MRCEPTDQQLREAFARMARRFGWACSFEDVCADPVRIRLVRVEACHPPRPAPQARAPRPTALIPLPARAERALRPLRAAYDHKRAAAGERDDD